MSILSVLNKTVKQFTENYSRLCIVRSINEYQLTIDVEPLDSGGYNFYTPNRNNYILNVRLGPRIEVFGKPGIYKIPSLNSLVIVSFLDKENAFVSLYSTLSNVNMKAQNIDFNLDDGVFIDNCDSFKIQTTNDVVTLNDITETNTEFIINNTSNILISTPINDLKIINEGIEFNSHPQKIYIGSKNQNTGSSYVELKDLYNIEYKKLKYGLPDFFNLIKWRLDILSIYNGNFMNMAIILLAEDIAAVDNTTTIQLEVIAINRTIEFYLNNNEALNTKRKAYDFLVYEKAKDIPIRYKTLASIESFCRTPDGLDKLNKSYLNYDVVEYNKENLQDNNIKFDYNYINSIMLPYFNNNLYFEIYNVILGISYLEELKKLQISNNIFLLTDIEVDKTITYNTTKITLINSLLLNYVTELESILLQYNYTLSTEERTELLNSNINEPLISSFISFCVKKQTLIVSIFNKALNNSFISTTITTTDENLKSYLLTLTNIISNLKVIDSNSVISPVIPAVVTQLSSINTNINTLLK